MIRIFPFWRDDLQDMLDLRHIVLRKGDLQFGIIAVLRRELLLVAVNPQRKLQVGLGAQAVEDRRKQFYRNVEFRVTLPPSVHALGGIEHKENPGGGFGLSLVPGPLGKEVG